MNIVNIYRTALEREKIADKNVKKIERSVIDTSNTEEIAVKNGKSKFGHFLIHFAYQHFNRFR